MSRLLNFAGSVSALTAIVMVGAQEITGTRLELYIVTASVSGLLLHFALRFTSPSRNASKQCP